MTLKTAILKCLLVGWLGTATRIFVTNNCPQAHCNLFHMDTKGTASNKQVSHTAKVKTMICKCHTHKDNTHSYDNAFKCIAKRNFWNQYFNVNETTESLERFPLAHLKFIKAKNGICTFSNTAYIKKK